jgi:2-keto-4-pentenoate hydratase/2-oxohepta-3-ene-1,7-dioic acid hydratase in catechol pathway
MELVTFESETFEVRTGVRIPQDGIIDLAASDPAIPVTMRGILEGLPKTLDRICEVVDRGVGVAVGCRRLLPPVPNPGKVVCIGLNYRDHAEETGAPIPSEPVVFNKFPSTVVGPGEPIVLPRVSAMVDYEAELVVVVGKRAKNVPVERAMDHVAGYTAGHDVSARDWQMNKGGKQWLLGKSFDTFAPLGPSLVTVDDVPDPLDLKIAMRINGKTLQESSTKQMIFGVDYLVSYLSQVFTLEPGDVIYTGTPPGVGFVRQPPVFLQPGDVCEVEIERIGILKNPCIAEADAHAWAP